MTIRALRQRPAGVVSRFSGPPPAAVFEMVGAGTRTIVGNAGGTTISAEKAGCTVGNLMIAALTADKNMSSAAASAGWTVATSYFGASVSGAIAYKICDTATESITWTSGNTQGKVAQVIETNLRDAVFESAVASAVTDVATTDIALSLPAHATAIYLVGQGGIDTGWDSSSPTFKAPLAMASRVMDDTSAGGAAFAVGLGTAEANTSRTGGHNTVNSDQQYGFLLAFSGTPA